MSYKTFCFASFLDGFNHNFTPDYLNFFYTFDTFRDLGLKNNLDVTIIQDNVHSYKQKMMKITFKNKH